MTILIIDLLLYVYDYHIAKKIELVPIKFFFYYDLLMVLYIDTVHDMYMYMYVQSLQNSTVDALHTCTTGVHVMY